jgi:hypothetical protein
MARSGNQSVPGIEPDLRSVNEHLGWDTAEITWTLRIEIGFISNFAEVADVERSQIGNPVI